MRTTLLLVGLLVAGVAAAPTASADHIVCIFPPAQGTCDAVVGVVNDAYHVFDCYRETPVKDWANHCV